jgi:hypothetical protein
MAPTFRAPLLNKYCIRTNNNNYFGNEGPLQGESKWGLEFSKPSSRFFSSIRFSRNLMVVILFEKLQMRRLTWKVPLLK